MKIFCTSEEVMLIEFTKDELEACHLTYEKLDKSPRESKNAICKIITETQKLSGESIKISEKTKVDILPDGEGGCLIVLNSKNEKEKFEKLKIYESSSLDPIFDFAKHIGKESVKSSLFKKDNIFRLVLSAPKAVHLKCREFLDLAAQGEKDSRKTSESYECLIAENALKILGGFTAKK